MRYKMHLKHAFQLHLKMKTSRDEQKPRQSQFIQSFQRALQRDRRQVDELKAFDPPTTDLLPLEPLTDESIMSLGI